MNHTEVNLSGMHQKVMDEISNILDCTYIGIDDVFTVLSTDTLSIEQFKNRTFYRVPCTCCEVYLKKYIKRNGYKAYGLAYLTNFSDYGVRRIPYYRVVRLEEFSSVLDVCDTPSWNTIDGYNITDSDHTWTYTIPTSSGRPVRFVMSSGTQDNSSAHFYGYTGYATNYNYYSWYAGEYATNYNYYSVYNNL